LDLQRELVGVDQLEPFALEDIAFVPRVPVAMLKLAAGDGVKLREALPVLLLIEVRVIGELRGNEDPALLPPLPEEPLVNPFVARTTGIRGAAHSNGHFGSLEPPETGEQISILRPRELR